jgi:hypothetical protein
MYQGNDFTQHFRKDDYCLLSIEDARRLESEAESELEAGLSSAEQTKIGVGSYPEFALPSEELLGADENRCVLLDYFEGHVLRVHSGTPNAADMELALSFTRRLYNFESLAGIPFDEGSLESSEVSPESAREMHLLREIALETFAEGGVEADLVPSTVAKYILREMEQHNPLSKGQRLAIVHALPAGKALGTAALAGTHNCEDRLQWNDVMLAKAYQKLCARVVAYVRKNPASFSREDQPLSLGDPSGWFQDERFHLLAQYFTTKLSETKTPESTEESSTSTTENKTKTKSGTNPSEQCGLPIDAHRDRICEHVREHQITIIHGETGCGKSSRIPQFLFEDASSDGSDVKMFVSQPRRIAATSLKTRVSSELGKSLRDPELGNQLVGLRMGHGVKQDHANTQIWFCTAGYLVLIASHHPEIFKEHTHLIIDEIHERSVDTDLLCYIVRDILKACPHLKLILMSATMAAETCVLGIWEMEGGGVGREREQGRYWGWRGVTPANYT